jgi:hypothetical protein
MKPCTKTECDYYSSYQFVSGNLEAVPNRIGICSNCMHFTFFDLLRVGGETVAAKAKEPEAAKPAQEAEAPKPKKGK